MFHLSAVNYTTPLYLFSPCRTIAERELSAKDNRNLYLLSEGVIDENHRGDMNERGMYFE